MKQEDYVTFDVAKLLKEKGFKNFTSETLCGNYNKATLYDAKKFLREQHDIEVSSIYDRGNKEWFFFVQKLDPLPEDVDFFSDSVYETYEQALNEGIKESLKYI